MMEKLLALFSGKSRQHPEICIDDDAAVLRKRRELEEREERARRMNDAIDDIVRTMQEKNGDAS
jgi:hypothetical protein